MQSCSVLLNLFIKCFYVILNTVRLSIFLCFNFNYSLYVRYFVMKISMHKKRFHIINMINNRYIYLS